MSSAKLRFCRSDACAAGRTSGKTAQVFMNKENATMGGKISFQLKKYLFSPHEMSMNSSSDHLTVASILNLLGKQKKTITPHPRIFFYLTRIIVPFLLCRDIQCLLALRNHKPAEVKVTEEEIFERAMETKRGKKRQRGVPRSKNIGVSW
jgi:hypothetical protein